MNRKKTSLKLQGTGGAEPFNMILKMGINVFPEEIAKESKQASATGIARQATLLEPEMRIRLIAVKMLGLTVIGSLTGAIILSITGRPIPELLGALGYTAVGALAGLLASMSRNE